MTERPSKELEELAAQLFAAARAERPGPALGRRLLLIDPRLAPHTSSPARFGDAASGAVIAARAPARTRLRRGLAAGALLAACAGVCLVWLRDEAEVNISAEHVPARGRVAALPPARAASVAPTVPREPSLPASNAAGAAVGEPPVTRAADAALHPRITQHHKPESAAPSNLTRATPSAAAARGAVVELPSGERAEAAPVRSAAPALTLLGELQLLKGARSALRAGDAPHALELLDTHARERGGSELLAEATLLRIEALSARGDKASASELATRFVQDNPHNALSDRAKSFVGGGTPHTP